ncbi:unnamed protein product [Cercopithifilaria johnstoni]|uniref:Uncharacterized protein n=1 Tax=Cercopithifilaria johnstoni TaxID=2874296 RepID=A0A8J2MV75_9BILA|nr:unnamed protein product [Cercopithifilaria johnstoni]
MEVENIVANTIYIKARESKLSPFFSVFNSIGSVVPPFSVTRGILAAASIHSGFHHASILTSAALVPGL